MCVCVRQFEVVLPFKEEAVLSYLQPGVEYCVTATVRTPFGGCSLTSPPHCAFTSPTPPSACRSHDLLSLSPCYVFPQDSCVVVLVQLVYILAVTCGALGPLLAILLFYGSQPAVRLLKRQLHRTMVTTPPHKPCGARPPAVTLYQLMPPHLYISLFVCLSVCLPSPSPVNVVRVVEWR